ncbi:hypothetical protein KUV57_11050 [Epibacterium sp. DP7N7-1]|nr:hypothetical protein [Epibacterium sp. DP7N7-1]
MTVHTLKPRGRDAGKELATYLRQLADHIESGEVETEPRAAMIVLTGRERHEVLHCGHSAEPGFLPGAVRAAEAVYLTPYMRAGGNMCPRTHQYGANEPDRENVVTLKVKDE